MSNNTQGGPAPTSTPTSAPTSNGTQGGPAPTSTPTSAPMSNNTQGRPAPTSAPTSNGTRYVNGTNTTGGTTPPEAPTALTCQAIKEAYKNQQCCTNPNADFQLPAAGTRRAKEPKGMGADWVRKLET